MIEQFNCKKCKSEIFLKCCFKNISKDTVEITESFATILTMGRTANLKKMAVGISTSILIFASMLHCVRIYFANINTCNLIKKVYQMDTKWWPMRKEIK